MSANIIERLGDKIAFGVDSQNKPVRRYPLGPKVGTTFHHQPKAEIIGTMPHPKQANIDVTIALQTPMATAETVRKDVASRLRSIDKDFRKGTGRAQKKITVRSIPVMGPQIGTLKLEHTLERRRTNPDEEAEHWVGTRTFVVYDANSKEIGRGSTVTTHVDGVRASDVKTGLKESRTQAIEKAREHDEKIRQKNHQVKTNDVEVTIAHKDRRRIQVTIQIVEESWNEPNGKKQAKRYPVAKQLVMIKGETKWVEIARGTEQIFIVDGVKQKVTPTDFSASVGVFRNFVIEDGKRGSLRTVPPFHKK